MRNADCCIHGMAAPSHIHCVPACTPLFQYLFQPAEQQGPQGMHFLTSHVYMHVPTHCHRLRCTCAQGPVSFVLGKDTQWIQGLQEVVSRMKQGGKVRWAHCMERGWLPATWTLAGMLETDFMHACMHPSSSHVPRPASAALCIALVDMCLLLLLPSATPFLICVLSCRALIPGGDPTGYLDCNKDEPQPPTFATKRQLVNYCKGGLSHMHRLVGPRKD